GRKVDLQGRQYLLSPQDLAGIELLPQLVAAGVSSLKIEGRLKSPEYVANITRTYRKAIDESAARSQAGLSTPTVDATDKYALEMAFSRGLFTGWFGGNDNQKLVHARFGKKRGVFLGKVYRVGKSEVMIELEAPLKPGDGVVFDAGTPDQKEEGGRVYEVVPERSVVPSGSLPNRCTLRFGHGDVNFTRIQAGHRVWKTSDPSLERELRKTFEGDLPKFSRPVAFEAVGGEGEPLTLILRDELGHTAVETSTLPLQKAEQHPLTAETLSKQLGRLGGTGLRLSAVTCKLEGQVILPASELNRMRRALAENLLAQRKRGHRWQLRPCSVSRPGSVPGLPKQTGAPELSILVRSLEQLKAALDLPVRRVYCELEDPKRYREATTLWRSARGEPDGECSGLFVAPPRITKMGEEWILKIIQSAEADGYLVRNYDHLTQFSGSRRVGDFSLNVANSLTASLFVERFGLGQLTPSYDLNFEQLSALLKAAPPELFEITIHQHIPMFHMEHCVFCAFLSDGKDYRDCGRPCEKREVRLKDRVGLEHPLKADAGCRNTLYNAVAQTGAEYVGGMLALGARKFRIEFLNEDPATVIQTSQMYLQLLRGEISGDELWRSLKLKHQLGVTRGSLDR
ncbi:MAG: U32 family peptidase, partial [Verrucomicrobia bacterium]|nr:U32 family peptidase [Verrucomicrobiota bacterium]